MGTKSVQKGEQFAAQERTPHVDTGRATLGVRRVLSSIGLVALTGTVYAGFLLAAVFIVGELVAYLPGLVGVVVLFTVGMLAIAAAPSVANWTLTRLLESLNRG